MTEKLKKLKNTIGNIKENGALLILKKLMLSISAIGKKLDRDGIAITQSIEGTTLASYARKCSNIMVKFALAAGKMKNDFLLSIISMAAAGHIEEWLLEGTSLLISGEKVGQKKDSGCFV